MIYQTAPEALAAAELGPRFLANEAEARKVTANPATTKSGRLGWYGLPIYHEHDGSWWCQVVEPLADGKDARGRDVQEGLLQDMRTT